MEIITKNAKETKEFGRKIADSLKPFDLVCFYGELGAGKTTLIQSIAKALGVEKRVISPTFIIVKEYKAKKNDIKTIYHVDLYRLIENKDEDIGLDDMLDDESVVVIEWPENLNGIFSKHIAWHVFFKHEEGNIRRILIKKQ